MSVTKEWDAGAIPALAQPLHHPPPRNTVAALLSSRSLLPSPINPFILEKPSCFYPCPSLQFSPRPKEGNLPANIYNVPTCDRILILTKLEYRKPRHPLGLPNPTQNRVQRYRSNRHCGLRGLRNLTQDHRCDVESTLQPPECAKSHTVMSPAVLIQCPSRAFGKAHRH